MSPPWSRTCIQACHPAQQHCKVALHPPEYSLLLFALPHLMHRLHRVFYIRFTHSIDLHRTLDVVAQVDEEDRMMELDLLASLDELVGLSEDA